MRVALAERGQTPIVEVIVAHEAESAIRVEISHRCRFVGRGEGVAPGIASEPGDHLVAHEVASRRVARLATSKTSQVAPTSSRVEMQ